MPKTFSHAKVPRLSIPVTPDQYVKLRKYLEYGQIKQIFSMVIIDIIDMLEKHGQHFVVAMAQRKISYDEMMNKYRERN